MEELIHTNYKNTNQRPKQYKELLIFGFILVLVGFILYCIGTNWKYSFDFFAIYRGERMILLSIIFLILGFIFMIVGLFKSNILKEEPIIQKTAIPKYNIVVCSECGNEIPSDSKFCNKCGKKFE